MRSPAYGYAPFMHFTHRQWQDAATALEDMVYAVWLLYLPEVHDNLLRQYHQSATQMHLADLLSLSASTVSQEAEPAEPHARQMVEPWTVRTTTSAAAPAHARTATDSVRSWLPASAQRYTDTPPIGDIATVAPW